VPLCLKLTVACLALDRILARTHTRARTPGRASLQITEKVSEGGRDILKRLPIAPFLFRLYGPQLDHARLLLDYTSGGLPPEPVNAAGTMFMSRTDTLLDFSAPKYSQIFAPNEVFGKVVLVFDGLHDRSLQVTGFDGGTFIDEAPISQGFREQFRISTQIAPGHHTISVDLMQIGKRGGKKISISQAFYVDSVVPCFTQKSMPDGERNIQMLLQGSGDCDMQVGPSGHFSCAFKEIGFDFNGVDCTAVGQQNESSATIHFRDIEEAAMALAGFFGVSRMGELKIQAYLWQRKKLLVSQRLAQINVLSKFAPRASGLRAQLRRFVVLSADSSHHYAFLLPVVCSVWSEVMGYRPFVLLIGSAWTHARDEPVAQGRPPSALRLVLDALKLTDAVLDFVSSEEHSDAFTARVSRLYASAYAGFHHAPTRGTSDDYLLVADVSLLPLSREYFGSMRDWSKSAHLYQSFCCAWLKSDADYVTRTSRWDGKFYNTHTDPKLAPRFSASYVGMSSELWHRALDIRLSGVSRAFENRVYRGQPVFPWHHPMLVGRGFDDDWYHESLLYYRLTEWYEFPRAAELVQRSYVHDRLELNDAPDSTFTGDLTKYVDVRLPTPAYTDTSWVKVRAILSNVVSRHHLEWLDKYRDDFLESRAHEMVGQATARRDCDYLHASSTFEGMFAGYLRCHAAMLKSLSHQSRVVIYALVPTGHGWAQQSINAIYVLIYAMLTKKIFLLDVALRPLVAEHVRLPHELWWKHRAFEIHPELEKLCAGAVNLEDSWTNTSHTCQIGQITDNMRIIMTGPTFSVLWRLLGDVRPYMLVGHTSKLLFGPAPSLQVRPHRLPHASFALHETTRPTRSAGRRK
jgi:hypothetical protein